MYIPKEFENHDLNQLQTIMETYNFATIISSTKSSNEIIVSHIPVMLERSTGRNGTLIWHMSNLNRHTSILDEENQTLCIFHGPHSYISPHWYQSKVTVPTWNYVAVHAHGIPVKTSAAELNDNLCALVNHHESIANKYNPYLIDKDYQSKLIEHITGFSMEITKLEGKFKLGQNRSKDDQYSMMENLRKNAATHSLADFIQEQLK